MRDSASSPGRLASLDAYRGFVILMMIFVNFLHGMPGIHPWLKHASADADTFTFPDLVFPGFLLMVGIAIPLALAKALAGDSLLPTLGKIAWRTCVLLAAGVVYENAYRYDEAAALLPKSLYMTLFFISLVAIWLHGSDGRNGTPAGRGPLAAAWKPWRLGLGSALLLALMLLFRGQAIDGFTSVYLEHTWWGILGLIGWSYLCCSLVYLLCRGSGTALMGSMAFMLALYMGGKSGRLDFLPEAVKGFVSVGEVFGSLSANVMAGVLVGRLFLPDGAGAGPMVTARLTPARRAVLIALFALGLLLAGLLLRPYHGINKINATESFTLVTSGINLLAFLAFYIAMDIFGWRAWAALLVPVGTNALLAYILPEFWNQFTALVGLGGLWWKFAWPYLAQGGWAGLANAMAVSLFMILLTAVATRFGYKLKS